MPLCAVWSTGPTTLAHGAVRWTGGDRGRGKEPQQGKKPRGEAVGLTALSRKPIRIVGTQPVNLSTLMHGVTGQAEPKAKPRPRGQGTHPVALPRTPV